MNNWRLTLSILVGFALPGFGGVKDFTEDSLKLVARIARAISIVQPYLADGQYIQYALEIHRASKRFHVEPAVLISIAQQETNFRENLPEGAAGEFGICQIRKMWLKHPEFKKEFKNASIKDLKRSGKNFLMAAWILSRLKSETGAKQTLPYWSYYNARRFQNRLKYYVAVNRYLAQLRKNEAYFSERAVAGAGVKVVAALPPVETKPQVVAERQPQSVALEPTNPQPSGFLTKPTRRLTRSASFLEPNPILGD